jgi:hypothetical protein
VPKKTTLQSKLSQWEERDTGFSTPCHVWTGPLNSGKERGGRYGRIYHGGKYVGAHRVAFEFEIGPIPAGKELHHLCDVTQCVNVAHLIPVTPTEHTRYSVNVKLDEDSVRAIRQGVVRAEDWATALGVSASLIYQVRAGTIWKHVD